LLVLRISWKQKDDQFVGACLNAGLADFARLEDKVWLPF
jgi:hypothetical protein